MIHWLHMQKHNQMFVETNISPPLHLFVPVINFFWLISQSYSVGIQSYTFPNSVTL